MMTFSNGERCFAKVKGFPHWPARINTLPDDVKVPKGKYPIFFYGTHEVCFLSGNAIFSYDKYKTKYGINRNTAGFNTGLEELESDATIYQLGVDPRAVKFLSQFYTFSTSKRNIKLNCKVENSTINDDENIVSLNKDINSDETNSDHCEKIDEIVSEITTYQSDLVVIKLEPTNEFKNPNEFLKLEQENIPTLSQNNINNISNNNIITPIHHFNSSNLSNKRKQFGKKCQTDEYANDFTNLLLEIRKYSWSKTKISDIKRLMKKNKMDSRVRIFFPWYQSLTKK